MRPTANRPSSPQEQPLIRHARYFVLQLAESYLTGSLLRQILGHIQRLAWHPT